MNKKWIVYYIEGKDEYLVSGKREVSASTGGIAKRKIENDNRIVTSVERAKPIRQRKIH